MIRILLVVLAACGHSAPSPSADASVDDADDSRLCDSVNSCHCRARHGCIMICRPGTPCHADADHDAQLEVTCTASDACDVACSDRATCVVDCNGRADCRVACPSARCEVTHVPPEAGGITCALGAPTRTGTTLTCP